MSEHRRRGSGRLDAEIIRDWSRLMMRTVGMRHREIDALNVYPVADRDTGSNLLQTLTGADAALQTCDSGDPGTLLNELATGAALHAHGNSGTILSQILRGIALGFPPAPESAGVALPGEPATAWCSALDLAAQVAYAAVHEAVEGTMLTVIAAAASAARNQLDSGNPVAVLEAAVSGARRALAATPTQLAVLERANVVDAGGVGVLIVLESLYASMGGNDAAALSTALGPTGPAVLPALGPSGPAVSPALGPTTQYEVQYLLKVDADSSIAGFAATLSTLGDSVTVAAATADLFAVHLHTTAPGPAVEAGLDRGRPSRISITPLTAVGPASTVVTAGGQPTPDPRTGTDIVALVSGAPLAALFAGERVRVLVTRADLVPSADELVEFLLQSHSRRLALLPNGAEAGEVAAAAAARARRRGLRIAVVPTRSPVQGLAAVAVHDEWRRFDDDVIAMAEAAAATRVAQVTTALSESITYAGRCVAGDILGLIDGEVVEIGSDVGRVGTALVRRLVAAGGELVTVLAGSATNARAAAATVEQYVLGRHPLVEISVLDAGQTDYPLIMGVE